MMKKSEQIALAAGVVTGMISGGLVLLRLHRLERENVRLKVDNINLLRNTFVALGCVAEDRPIPHEVITDLEFRRMAFVAEFDYIKDEDA